MFKELLAKKYFWCTKGWPRIKIHAYQASFRKIMIPTFIASIALLNLKGIKVNVRLAESIVVESVYCLFLILFINL